MAYARANILLQRVVQLEQDPCPDIDCFLKLAVLGYFLIPVNQPAKTLFSQY